MTIADGLGDGPEAESNARLIASAPELLAALEACVPWLESIHEDEDDDRAYNAGVDASVARAAIAKAMVGV